MFPNKEQLKKKPRIILAISLCALSLLSSCLAIKPGSVRSGQSLFETFYVGEDGTQYFIKPLYYQNKEIKALAKVDYTFRYKDKIKDSVIINVSLISKELTKKLDSIVIENGNKKVVSGVVKLLFNERLRKDYVSRFTTKIGMADFTDLFLSKTWTLVVYNSGKSSAYIATGKAEKATKKLNDRVFVLFRE